ncbi:hypothetical protein RhiirC2_856770 [Rhizophagus irregularis]|uniref:Uncharacterized protein n=1 Tax=Rhizophagus irregularis TaxID=588596 RepID=A0A2N1MG41_9GLOM|nr:hypothetical protein RhiirC2_856770 [Rhizophagus irregularis]
MFVPYEKFENIELSGEGGFSKIYKATWIGCNITNEGPGSSATSFYRSNSSFLLDPGSSAFRLFGYKVPALWQLRRFNILAPQPNQFLRGLNKENSIKSERIGVKRDIEELVNLLERVEKERTAPGKERQDALQYHQDHYIEPIQLPSVTTS